MQHLRITLTSVFILFVIQCLFAQNIEDKFNSYQESHHLEKVYVNTDKSFYLLGDTIWCQAYFVDGRSHTFFEASPIVRAEWITPDKEIAASMLLKIDEGTAQFDIPLPLNLTPGKYTLRAYTRYQRNFDPSYLFQKQIWVMDDKTTFDDTSANTDKIKLSFFPEGGDLITGLKNKIAFEALLANGDAADISGIIRDNNQNEIAKIKTFNDGVGFFEFIPEAGLSYHAVINTSASELSFDLPQTKESGASIRVNSRSTDFITVQLQSNLSDAGLDKYQLVVHCRGSIILDLEIDETSSKQLKLARTDLPSGIIHFTLFDNKINPVAERLAFNRNPNELVNVSLENLSEQYSKRQQLEFDISSKRAEKIIPSTMSVSIYNQDIIPEGSNDLTIENYLLLQSDIQSRIPNLDQYFINNDAKSNFLLDMLLLTKGWRRFTWTDIMDGKSPMIEFDTEEEIQLVGRIFKAGTDKAVKADAFLSIMSADNFGSVNMTTEDDGVFYFTGFNFQDTTDVIIQANIHDPKKKKKQKDGEIKRTGNKNVDIEMLNLEPIVIDQNHSIKNQIKNPEESVKTIAKEFKEIKHYESLYNPDWSIDLEEITVKAQRKTETEKKKKDLEDLMKDRGMISVASSEKIFMEDLPGGGSIYEDIFQIVRAKVAGAQVRGSGFERFVVLRGVNSIQEVTQAKFFVDGIEVPNISSLNLNPTRILAIDVIRGLYASTLYGSGANGGVISIITKDPSKVNVAKAVQAKGTINMQHPGYYQGREFYKPSYAKKSIDTERPDLRTTIYWNPAVNIKSKSKTIKFYSGDKSGRFLIRVEGISGEGVPFVARKVFRVE